MKSDKTIRHKPEESVLGYKVGEATTLTEADFARLSDAYFAAIEAKFR